MQKRLLSCILCASLVLAIPATSALGQPMASVDKLFFRVSDGSGGVWNHVEPVAGDLFKGEYSKTLTDITLGGVTIEELEVFAEADPVVRLRFLATNDSGAAADLEFQWGISFAAVNNAVGKATASISLIDNEGDGAVVGPHSTNPGGNLYFATYNGGTSFASLLTGVTIPPDVADSQSDSVGETPIGVPVTSMLAEFKINLSAGDSAAGLSTFTVTPEPATIGLLSLGWFFVARRRR